MPPERIHFITGRLAEFALRAELERLRAEVGFSYTVEVLPITVAALMSTDWVARHVAGRVEADRAVLPGYCHGELAPIAAALGVPVERGPHDPAPAGRILWTGGPDAGRFWPVRHRNPGRNQSRPAIVARGDSRNGRPISSGRRRSDRLGLRSGRRLARASGKPCERLVDAGHRVSIDSMNAVEIAAAVRAGAELVLSVNSANRHAAADWGCEVVAVPDVPATLAGLDETVEHLAGAKVRLRIDPILEPIGCGFAASLGRYLDVRRRYPDAEMLMGIGNLTELTDADSAAINVLLLGFCQELSIHSVLTTEVINWARTSVRECDLARRLVYFAVRHRLPPKRLDSGLVILRDAVVPEFGQEYLEKLAREIRDHNYRLFAEESKVHAVTAGEHWAETDPFLLFEQMAAAAEKPIDANHAFYLGYEMAKAVTGADLGQGLSAGRGARLGLFDPRGEFASAGPRQKGEQPARPMTKRRFTGRIGMNDDARSQSRDSEWRPVVVPLGNALAPRRRWSVWQAGRTHCFSTVRGAIPSWAAIRFWRPTRSISCRCRPMAPTRWRMLTERLAPWQTDTVPGLPPFQGGAAGVWAYDLNRSLEQIARPAFDEFQVPALAVGLYDVVLAFDHRQAKPGSFRKAFPSASRQPRRRARTAGERITATGSTSRHRQDILSNSAERAIAADRMAPQFRHGRAGGAGQQFFGRRIRGHGRAGDRIHSRRRRVSGESVAAAVVSGARDRPLALYVRLRRCNPAPFAGYFDLGEFQIASASPERFLKVAGGDVETRPIKGTRQRTRQPEADLFAGDDLSQSEKDRAENVMIVDLMRNDLAKVCQADSVRVTQLCQLESYQFVQHLVSAVRGRLRPELAALDLLRAAFPGGSISGAPKVRAMEIIAELEPTARGAYCGALGYVGFDGSADTNLLIRTVTAGRGWWQAPVGGGIVAQSHPQREYEETWHKAAGILRLRRGLSPEA